jgi:hypothetical protein
MFANTSLGPAAALAAALVAVTPNRAAMAEDPTALPRTKVNLEACFRAATVLHPGTVERVQVRNRGAAFYFRLTTRDQYGREGLAICDGATGRSSRSSKASTSLPKTAPLHECRFATTIYPCLTVAWSAWRPYAPVRNFDSIFTIGTLFFDAISTTPRGEHGES